MQAGPAQESAASVQPVASAPSAGAETAAGEVKPEVAEEPRAGEPQAASQTPAAEAESSVNEEARPAGSQPQAPANDEPQVASAEDTPQAGPVEEKPQAGAADDKRTERVAVPRPTEQVGSQYRERMEDPEDTGEFHLAFENPVVRPA
ncbi:hypothetical protein [Kribbella sp. HUAS MG21]|uniref:hypothetical protein n=1 Tax=Kribbella sp. HUAS MG21 TaxID=3160966 RepID=UPI00330664C1